ncbi:MAG TPA: hypothetical protein VIK66_14855 [Gaiellaceae bacterium]|jgi:hypothetical protein
MARKSKQDVAKAKAAKQKKIAIGGGILLVALLAYQGPKVMKMMNQKPKPPIVAAVTTTPGSTSAAPTDPNSLAAPTLGGTPTAAAPTTGSDDASTNLVSAVPVSPDPGQLEAFNRLATKDPFAEQVSASGAPAGSGSKGSTKTPPASTTPVPTQPAPTPPMPAPSSATISLNGEQLSVSVGTDFPQSGATFNRVGAIFHLVSLTARSAKISIVGGSYADGANTITLTMGKPLTLQNTADGTRYVLTLEPAAAQSGSSGSSTTPSSTTPTTTTTPAGNGTPMSAIVPSASSH